ncbi:hypothetical protein AAG906_037339 [Vitis piasezkii]
MCGYQRDGKKQVLIVGGTGYLGKGLVKASLAQGHSTYEQGAHLVSGSFVYHQSLVDAVKLVDVVISAISGVHLRSHHILLQLKLVDVIKEAGNIKRFLPSEFGTDPARMENAMEPGRVTFDDKMAVRKAIQEAGIPFTYVSANCFAGYFVGGLCQPGGILPSRDHVVLFGDGNQKFVEIWEKLIGKQLQKSSISKEEFLTNMKTQTYAVQVGSTHCYHVFYDGCHANFEIGDGAEEASQLYPEIKYTTVHEYMKDPNHALS